MAVQSLVKYSNYFKTVLSEALDTTETGIDVQSISGLPTITGSQYYYLTITRASDNAKEIVKVTSVSTLTLTVTRASDSTTALAFSIGDKVELLVVNALLDDLYSELSSEIDKIDFADAAAANHEDVAVENTIAKLVSDAGGGDVLIHLAVGTYTFTESYTVPRNVTLSLEDGALISIANSKTVTIAGTIRSGRTQLFTGAGVVAITQQSPVMVEWWGGYGDDSTDCATAIAAAIAATPSAGGMVQFTNGVYRIESSTALGATNEPLRQTKFLPGAMIGTVGTITLTVYNQVHAGRHQIFSRASGSGTFTGSDRTNVAYPEWFGALADGNDDRAAIEDALAYLPAGGHLEFQPNASHLVNEDIDVSKSVTITGGKFTLPASPSSGTSIFHVTADDVHIERCVLDISGVTTGGEYSGVYGIGADDLVLRDIKIDTPNALSTANAGIFLDDCDRARVTSIHVVDAEKNAISLKDCENCVLSDITIKSPGQYGVSVENGEHNGFSNINVITAAVSGFYLNSSAYANLSNVNIDNATVDGMLINEATNTSIVGGAIKASNNANSGIKIQSTADGVTVTGMRIEGYTGTSSAAVATSGAAKNIAIVGCNLQGNYKETDFHSNTSNTKITGNILGGVSESYLLMLDEKASGTDIQALSSGSWTARDLTKKAADTGGYANLDTDTNEFTLAPGTYRFRISCPAFNTNAHQARLYNVTNSKVEAYGTTQESYGIGVHTDLKGNTLSSSVILGSVALTGPGTFKIEHWIQSGTGNKLRTDWQAKKETPEIYTQAEFWRITEDAISSNALSGENHVSFTFDAESRNKAVGTYGIGRIPDNCIVTKAWYEVINDFVGSGATISIGIENNDVDGIKSATPIAATNEVQTITFDAAMTGGVLSVTVYAPDGTPLVVTTPWDTNIATTIAAWNVAMTAAATAWYGGASAGAVMTGTATVPVLTYSGNGFADLPFRKAEVDIDSTTGPEYATIARTTSGGGFFTVGNHKCIQDGDVYDYSEKTDADRDVQVTVAVATLTDGKLILHLTYIVSE